LCVCVCLVENAEYGLRVERRREEERRGEEK
jgi:hypothetical protein